MSVGNHYNQKTADAGISSPQQDVSQLGDGRHVRQLLVKIGKAFQKNQAPIAGLLVEYHDKGYWRLDNLTFKEYVDCELGIKVRKAQELMKVYASACSSRYLPKKIDELGWSKLAIVASSISATNVDDMMKNVADKTYAELQNEQKHHRDNLSAKKTTDAKIIVTEVIERALRLAAARVNSLDTQGYLECIATHYLQSVSRRPGLSRRNG